MHTDSVFPVGGSYVGWLSWQACVVRYKEFWDLVDEVFGRAYGRTLAQDQVLAQLEDRTAAQCLDDGVEPRLVWHVLCDALEVPTQQRWGTDPFRQAPPRK